jgi:hypothetical protein
MGSTLNRQLALEKRQQDLRANLTAYNRLIPGGTRGWNPLRNPVHFHLLNGVRTPGICSFPMLESAEKWDLITGPGLSGQVPVFRGSLNGEFDVVYRLYDNEDWDQFHVYLPLLGRAPRGRRPQALRILHPIFDFFDPPIRAVVKPKWRLGEPDELGITTFTVSFVEFRKIIVQQAKPEAAKPEPTKDPWDQKIETMTAQVQELAQ